MHLHCPDGHFSWLIQMRFGFTLPCYCAIWTCSATEHAKMINFFARCCLVNPGQSALQSAKLNAGNKPNISPSTLHRARPKYTSTNKPRIIKGTKAAKAESCRRQSQNTTVQNSGHIVPMGENNQKERTRVVSRTSAATAKDKNNGTYNTSILMKPGPDKQTVFLQ